MFRRICVIALFVGGIVATTQSFAHAMNEDVQVVGHPLFHLFGKAVYNPAYYVLSFIRYGSYDQFQPYFLKSFLYFLVCGILAFLILIVWTIVSAAMLNSERNNVFGTAREATNKDLKENGFLNTPDGIILGYTKDAKVSANKKEDGTISLKLYRHARFITNPGKLNTLLLAPTGSGKGVSVIMPTLLSFLQHMVIFDPKEENYNKTAGYRATFSHVIKFAPCSMNTMRFNPVMAIRDGDVHAFRDANLIADILFAPSKVGGGQNDTEAYFSNAAKNIVTGALLHIRFSDYPDKSLHGLLKFLTHTNYTTLKSQAGQGEANASQGVTQGFAMIDSTHYYTVTEEMFAEKADYYQRRGIKAGMRIEATGIHEKIVESATRAMNMNAKEKSSTFSTVYSKLQLFDDPAVAYATSGNDFEIEDFQKSEKPISLYMCVPYSDVTRISPVFRMLVSFMLRKFTEDATAFGEVKLSHNLLFLFDEFPILGCFPDIAEVMGVLRGYGIFFLIVAQALNQLVDRYGVNHPFLDHCPVQVIFAPGSVNDAEMYSKAIGSESIHQDKVSHSGTLRIGTVNNLNFSENDQGRNLFDAADLKRLPGDKALIISHGMQPYLAEKVVYYQDKRFKAKLAFKAPESMKELYRQVAGLPSIQAKKRKVALQKERFNQMTVCNPDLEVITADDEQMELEADILGTDKYFMPDFGKETEENPTAQEMIAVDALADDDGNDGEESGLA